jgi:hypothetical protein
MLVKSATLTPFTVHQAYLLFGKHNKTRTLVREALAVCRDASFARMPSAVSHDLSIPICVVVMQVLRGVDVAIVDSLVAAVFALTPLPFSLCYSFCREGPFHTRTRHSQVRDVPALRALGDAAVPGNAVAYYNLAH